MAYIANKWNSAQITNIHYWDSVGGAWSGNLVGAATPFALLPNPVNANDFVIFGIDNTVLDSGPFSSLVFDIQVPNVATIVWKYSDAGGGILPTAWAPIVTIQDNTNQDGLGGGVAFDTVGIRSVQWIPDVLWIAQNPTVGGVALGVTGLWICADVTGGAGGAPPLQQNRDIYTVTWPAMNLPEVGGDIQALFRTGIRVESGQAQHRWVAGLRRASRGVDFRSFINASNKQNPMGITATAVAPWGFVNSIYAPTGQLSRGVPTVVGNSPLTILFSQAYASQYKGTFRLFLRANQLVPPNGTVSFDVVQILGSGTATTTTWESKRVTLTTNGAYYEVLDMGRIQIPGADIVEPYTLRLGVRAYGDGIVGAEVVDMILIPVDEWAIDIQSPILLHANRNVVGELGQVAEVDSIQYPRRIPRAIGYAHSTGALHALPRFIGGSGGLIPNTTQNLHSLTMTTTAGIDYSYPYVVESNDFFQVVQRYSSMRGAR